MKKLLLIALILVLTVSCASTSYEDLKAEGFTESEIMAIQQRKGYPYNIKGGIFIGMSKRALLASWGRPTRTHTTTNSYGIYEQLVYEDGYSYTRTYYVYVENGYVVSWQT